MKKAQISINFIIIAIIALVVLTLVVVFATGRGTALFGRIGQIGETTTEVGACSGIATCGSIQRRGDCDLCDPCEWKFAEFNQPAFCGPAGGLVQCDLISDKVDCEVICGCDWL